MKSKNKYFRLVFTFWICVLFLICPTFLNEINMKISENSNQLHTAVTYTNLSYFTWGGSGSESAYDVTIDSSNNTYIVGSTDSFGAGGSDLCLLKFNSSGLEWNQTYGGIYGERGTSIVLDSFDNIYVTGYTTSYGAGSSDIWLLKINSSGGVEWNYTWGGIEDEIGWCITLDSQNNAYIAGHTKSFGAGEFDMCLVKFNSSGLVWNYTCGGIDFEKAYSLTLDPLGNAYVVGSTDSYGMGKTDLYLVKFNSSGTVWNKTWGCADWDQGTEIIYSPSGDLYVAGFYEYSPDCSKPAEYGPIPQYISLIKFNSEGIYQWNNTWTENNLAYTYAMVMDSSGNAYVAGYCRLRHLNEYDMCLIRFNTTGQADWSCIWGGNETELSQGLVLGPNGTALVVGYTMSYGAGSSDLCMVEFKIGQCPVTLPDNGIPPDNGTPPIIPGYHIVIPIGIAFAVSILLFKRKIFLSNF